MRDKLPACLCGSTSWNQGGGSYGGAMSTTYYSCPACQRRAISLYASGYDVLIMFKEGDEPVLDTWINRTLMICARAFETRWDKIKSLIDQANRDSVIMNHGVDPTKGFVWGNEYIDHHPNANDNEGNPIPQDIVAAIHTDFHDMYCGPNPTTLITPPIPPNLPEGITAYLWQRLPGQTNQEFGYVQITPEASKRAFMPLDPHRESQIAYWKGVMNDLTGYCWGDKFVPELTEIPNEYFNDVNKCEPWYTFKFRGATFKVGWRKRVVNVEIDFGTKVTVTKLRDLGVRDNTTYYAEGGWKSKTETAQTVCIHAWDKEKLLEYLRAAIQIAREEA